MKAVGVICECNPLHAGHVHLLRTVREAFPEKGILCLMSGNFVQRGEFAVQEKFSRARTLLSAGADLVLELPFPFSCLSAEGFAGSAVSACDTLAFGSEIADRERLSLCAARLADPAFGKELADFRRENRGVGYPAARSRVYCDLYGEETALALPNASLALEYLMAISRLGAELAPFPVCRIDSGPSGAFTSASALRAALRAGKAVSGRVPPFAEAVWEAEREAGRFPVDMEALAPVILYLLKTRSRAELCGLYGFSAVCARLQKAAGECRTVQELVAAANGADLTDSRIRRALVALLCGVPRRAEEEVPAYTQLLAANKKGTAMLRKIAREGEIPVFTKPASALRAPSPAVRRQASASRLADEIYAMAFPSPARTHYPLTQTPAVI